MAGFNLPQGLQGILVLDPALICTSRKQLVTKLTLFYPPYMLSCKLYKKTRRGARCLSCSIPMVYLAMLSPTTLLPQKLEKRGRHPCLLTLCLCVSVCSRW